MEDATSVSVFYLVTKWSELFNAFKSCKDSMENQSKGRMYYLRLDRSGEAISGGIKSFPRSQDTKLEPSRAYASKSNGYSERLIQINLVDGPNKDGWLSNGPGYMGWRNIAFRLDL